MRGKKNRNVEKGRNGERVGGERFVGVVWGNVMKVEGGGGMMRVSEW